MRARALSPNCAEDAEDAEDPEAQAGRVLLSTQSPGTAECDTAPCILGSAVGIATGGRVNRNVEVVADLELASAQLYIVLRPLHADDERPHIPEVDVAAASPGAQHREHGSAVYRTPP